MKASGTYEKKRKIKGGKGENEIEKRHGEGERNEGKGRQRLNGKIS